MMLVNPLTEMKKEGMGWADPQLNSPDTRGTYMPKSSRSCKGFS